MTLNDVRMYAVAGIIEGLDCELRQRCAAAGAASRARRDAIALELCGDLYVALKRKPHPELEVLVDMAVKAFAESL